MLAALLAIGVIVFMKRSRMGQAIRATAQDARAARVLGIDTEKVYSFTFCLNAAICGAAGALVAVVWNAALHGHDLFDPPVRGGDGCRLR
ncbi:MAG: hypothetical protein KIT82_02345 [Bradyrhizobium sp.]|nr:hypothetical protein [Bradyrhizobium sp.]